MPIDQLNRASRLLLGALLEAHDMLEQMHTDSGSVPDVEQSVKDNIERVRRLSTEITLSEDARKNLAGEAKDKKKEEKTAPEAAAASTKPISEETPNNELPVPVCLPSTEADCAAKASVSDQTTTTRMPDVVPELTHHTPTKNDLTNIPDVLHTAVSRRRVPPRKSPGTKPTSRRRVFRLNTLQELQASKKAARPQPLTWTEAGAKLAEVAGSWRSNNSAIATAANPGRHQARDASASRRLNTEEENWDGGTAKVFVTGVVKIVSCVSLYLIVRKMESLLK